jgi:uncharacterized membrane protein
MPFCSQCGKPVDAGDAYCANCGARQPITAPFSGAPGQAFERISSLNRISPRTAAICCYIPGLGWVASILVLAAQRFRTNRAVRFHAFQGLYLFVAWLLNDWVVQPISNELRHFPLHGLIEVALFVMSIFMMVKAAHNEVYSLPLFGELAERSVSEQ